MKNNYRKILVILPLQMKYCTTKCNQQTRQSIHHRLSYLQGHPILIKITFVKSNIATFFFIIGFFIKFWVLGDDSSLGLWVYCDNSAENKCCQLANSLSYWTSSKTNGELYSHLGHALIQNSIKRITLNCSKIPSRKKKLCNWIVLVLHG